MAAVVAEAAPAAFGALVRFLAAAGAAASTAAGVGVMLSSLEKTRDAEAIANDIEAVTTPGSDDSNVLLQLWRSVEGKLSDEQVQDIHGALASADFTRGAPRPTFVDNITRYTRDRTPFTLDDLIRPPAMRASSDEVVDQPRPEQKATAASDADPDELDLLRRISDGLAAATDVDNDFAEANLHADGTPAAREEIEMAMRERKVDIPDAPVLAELRAVGADAANALVRASNVLSRAASSAANAITRTNVARGWSLVQARYSNLLTPAARSRLANFVTLVGAGAGVYAAAVAARSQPTDAPRTPAPNSALPGQAGVGFVATNRPSDPQVRTLPDGTTYQSMYGVAPLVYISVLGPRRAIECFGADEAEDEARNKRMHADNGNTMPMADAAINWTMPRMDTEAALSVGGEARVATYYEPGGDYIAALRHPTVSLMGTTQITMSIINDNVVGQEIAVTTADIRDRALMITGVTAASTVQWSQNAFISDIANTITTGLDRTGVQRSTGSVINGQAATDMLAVTTPEWKSGVRPSSTMVGLTALLYALARPRANVNPCPGNLPIYHAKMAPDDMSYGQEVPWAWANGNTVDNGYSVVARLVTAGEYYSYLNGHINLVNVDSDGKTIDVAYAVTTTVVVPVNSAMAHDSDVNTVWALCHMGYPYKQLSKANGRVHAVFADARSAASAVTQPASMFYRTDASVPGPHSDTTPASARNCLRLLYVMVDQMQVRPDLRTASSGATFSAALDPAALLTARNSFYGQDLALGTFFKGFAPTASRMATLATTAWQRWTTFASREESTAALRMAVEFSAFMPKPFAAAEVLNTAPLRSGVAWTGVGGVKDGYDIVPQPIVLASWTQRLVAQLHTTPSGMIMMPKAGSAYPTCWRVAKSSEAMYVAAACNMMTPMNASVKGVDITKLDPTLARYANGIAAVADTLAQRANLPYVTFVGGLPADNALPKNTHEFTTAMVEWWNGQTYSLGQPVYPMTDVQGEQIPVAMSAREPMARADITAHALINTVSGWSDAWASPMSAAATENGVAVSEFYSETDANSDRPLASVILNGAVDVTQTTLAAGIRSWDVVLDGVKMAAYRTFYPAHVVIAARALWPSEPNLRSPANTLRESAPVVSVTTAQAWNGTYIAQQQLRTTDYLALREGRTVLDRAGCSKTTPTSMIVLAEDKRVVKQSAIPKRKATGDSTFLTAASTTGPKPTPPAI